ncbi:YdeI/OmpD-associated family protein [Actinomadura xylanilytica]|uniref:YdeI/OmpD-associated family protein n=1 Tax=Actinomadura xylanilytica TaxID=887459 RepID=UPI00255B24E0|nr:YdeI/OmpD-associated family protein [Actinomadura xylanilytica]MDL4775561.1 YdeI/OmpD-associated family protein [Actinomadura xylanilytica]
MPMPADSVVLVFEDASQWESWLADHHDRAEIWLKLAKKNSGRTTVTRAQALDVALCYGWIDSHSRSCDETYSLQRYSPRRAKSPWSKINVDKAEMLIAAGRMRPSGLAAITAAKADGRWDAAYASQRNATVPPDLVAALERDPRAKDAFDRLSGTDRYAVLLRLMKTRTPETRAAVLRRAVDALTQDAEDG